MRVKHWIMILVSYRFCLCSGNGKAAGGSFWVISQWGRGTCFLKHAAASLWKALCSPDLEKEESWDAGSGAALGRLPLSLLLLGRQWSSGTIGLQRVHHWALAATWSLGWTALPCWGRQCLHAVSIRSDWFMLFVLALTPCSHVLLLLSGPVITVRITNAAWFLGMETSSVRQSGCSCLVGW